MQRLEVDGAEIVDRGVTTPRVVPGRDPLEDGGGELPALAPALTVKQIELQRSEVTSRKVV